MKLKSVAGIVCYVKDINKTAKFYEALGFQFDKRIPTRVSIRLNWFWIDFYPIALEDKPTPILRARGTTTTGHSRNQI